jgi:AraC-like DNA-binding protein
MGDALRALIEAAGLTVHYGHEVQSDDEQWTLDLDASVGSVWVACSSGADVWIRQGDDVDLVRQGTAALFGPQEALTIGTDLDRAPPPTSDGGLFGPTGVHTGTATFGPFGAEAFPLPRLARTHPLDAPHDDVLRTLGHIETMSGAPWCDALRDTLAAALVTAILRDNPPALLADRSIARCIDRLVDADVPVPMDELRRGTRVSASTIRRRFRTTTGCSPEQLRRWFRSFPVRAALADGTDPAVVARRFGYSTVSSMRRALGRVRAPETHVPSAC